MQVQQYQPIFIARQPIFDQKDRVQAYELLFRNSQAHLHANISDPIKSTLDVISYGFDLAVSATGGRKPAFINFPQQLLLEKSALALPASLCIIEILETVKPDQEVLDACRFLKEQGYKIALDDFCGQPGQDKLVELADIVKVDILKMPPKEIKQISKYLQQKKVQLLAEKIENVTIYGYCKQMGFNLFQGFFFCSPQLLAGCKLVPQQASRLKLLKSLAQENIELKELARIIQGDAGLSYRLLRFVNSAFFGFRNKISSVQHAVSLLGTKQVSQWLKVSVLSDLSTTPPAAEAASMAAQRGKFLELLSSNHSSPPFASQSMFLLGMFSLLDALLGQPLHELLEDLPIPQDMKNALILEETPFTPWIKLTQYMEKGSWDDVQEAITYLEIDQTTIAMLHSQSLLWTANVLPYPSKPGSIPGK